MGHIEMKITIIQSRNENEINTSILKNTEKGRDDEKAKEKKMSFMHHSSSETKSHGIK